MKKIYILFMIAILTSCSHSFIVWNVKDIIVIGIFALIAFCIIVALIIDWIGELFHYIKVKIRNRFKK